MSVLIKSMKMPKCCYECVFYDDEEAFCYAVRNFVDERLVQKQRDHDCPLVEVPPHGRLIDADDLEELFREVIGGIANKPEMCGSLEHMIRASAMVIEMINDAPTIIEAEEKE